MVPGPVALEETAEDAEPRSGPRDPTGIAAHEPYLRLIRGVLVTRKVPSADLEDVRQDVVMGVLRAVASPEPVRSMRKLIVYIAGCRAVSHLRRAALRRGLPLDEEAEGGSVPESQRAFPDPHRAIEERERAAALPLLLERLPPKLREVFCLVDLEEMTVAGAARALGLKESTARLRYNRARERFEELRGPVRAEIERRGR
jgi:RNA polymerase sigma-70 factor (ECF subfamily)